MYRIFVIISGIINKLCTLSDKQKLVGLIRTFLHIIYLIGLGAIPADTRRRINVVLTLVHRRKPTLILRGVSAGTRVAHH